VSGGVLRGRHRLRLAGSHVELRAVPRTGDLAVAKSPFAQRSAVVRADVVDAVDVAVDLAQNDDPLADLDDQRSRIRNIGDSCNFRKFSHVPPARPVC